MKNKKTVKTTITIPIQLWEDFTIKVIRKQGGRKKNDVIAELLRQYLKPQVIGDTYE